MSGKYIVVFKDSVSEVRIETVVNDVKVNGGLVTRRFDGIIMKGFAATIPDQYITTLQSLQGNEIDYIEPDGEVSTQQT